MNPSRWPFIVLTLLLTGLVAGTFIYERNSAHARRQEALASELAQRIPAGSTVTAAASNAVDSKTPKATTSKQTDPSTADQLRIKKEMPADETAEDESEVPEWGNPSKLPPGKTQKIAEIFPETKDLPLPDLLSHLAVTDFQATGPVVFEGADENYHEYDQNGPHGEQVQKYFSPEGGLAIEQINYSQDEQIVKRYSPQSTTLAEVSYEYKNQGGVLRFQPDGSVESFHTWDQNNNQILTRYNPAGQATEVWQWSPESDWKQVR